MLIAGGRNKGLDLAVAGARARIGCARVVAIGEAADEIDGRVRRCVPRRAAPTSMDEAVAEAAALAEPGDAVLLSPACASFDWYPDGGYPARGDDFRRLVVELHATSPSGDSDMSTVDDDVIGDRRRQALERAAALRRHPTASQRRVEAELPPPTARST